MDLFRKDKTDMYLLFNIDASDKLVLSLVLLDI